jgi:tRNA threonylcarbamoyladenosine biosynthesis protein TsaE
VKETITRGEEETEALGEELATSLGPDDVLYLRGELGSGKTALVRGLARGLGALPREVASPTFALLHEYANAAGAIVLRHLDLYRLDDSEEHLEPLGLPGAVSGAPVAVEWPGRALGARLPATIEVELFRMPDGARRIATRRLAGAGQKAMINPPPTSPV